MHEMLRIATEHLLKSQGHEFKQLSLSKPDSPFEALNMLRIVSKLSPIIGNLFEIDAVELLSAVKELNAEGRWLRQDPGFPDVILDTGTPISPGFEIKAWYPLSTEITGRFKDSQNRFSANQTQILMFAWLPEHFLYGTPQIVDLCIVSGKSVAAARDKHYHNPPDYLVIEPLDTSKRTKNLQQTNTSGYKFQGSASDLKRAQDIVTSWGADGSTYKPTLEYQLQLSQLMNSFKYRLDTNYAKMDRVIHPGIEDFKTRVQSKKIEGRTISEWMKFVKKAGPAELGFELKKRFGIEEGLPVSSLVTSEEATEEKNSESE